MSLSCLRSVSRRVLPAGLAVLAMLFVSSTASAQRSQRGQPKTPFSVNDFSRLHWLEGTWRGSSPSGPTFTEQYRFVNDSTIEITYRDSTNTRQTGTGRIYLSVGRIYYTLGSGRWGASRADSAGLFFVPQVNAHNTYAWDLTSPTTWSSTMRTGMGGREHVTVYTMKRVSP